MQFLSSSRTITRSTLDTEGGGSSQPNILRADQMQVDVLASRVREGLSDGKILTWEEPPGSGLEVRFNSGSKSSARLRFANAISVPLKLGLIDHAQVETVKLLAIEEPSRCQIILQSLAQYGELMQRRKSYERMFVDRIQTVGAKAHQSKLEENAKVMQEALKSGSGLFFTCEPSTGRLELGKWTCVGSEVPGLLEATRIAVEMGIVDHAGVSTLRTMATEEFSRYLHNLRTLYRFGRSASTK